VLQAAHAVRTATKQLYDGEVMHPETIGAARHGLYHAFQDVLAKNDPAGAVKLILAFDPGANSRAEVNAAYAKLVAQQTEPKIFAAMQKMATTNPSPEYGEYKNLMRALGAGGVACEPDLGIARGGKGAAIGGATGGKSGTAASSSGCAPETANASVSARADVPYVPNPELPRYDLTESSAASSISFYCSSIYNPPQPLLSQQEIQKYYANQTAVDGEVKRCVSSFDVKRTIADRKQAMRFCLVHYDFSVRTSDGSRKAYDICMNQNDTETALCTLEFRNREELNRKKGFGSDSGELYCRGIDPSSRLEYNVVKFGGSEDMGHFKVPDTGPGLPPVLKAPLPAGLLHAQIPVAIPAGTPNTGTVAPGPTQPAQTEAGRVESPQSSPVAGAPNRATGAAQPASGDQTGSKNGSAPSASTTANSDTKGNAVDRARILLKKKKLPF
jgi:hypothetical protein